MSLDTYMADGGRYRRRRHSVYAVHDGAIELAPHQAHFQGLDFNTLTHALDSVLLDDHCVYHGVTAIAPLDPTKPAWRDVLVVTFLAAG